MKYIQLVGSILLLPITALIDVILFFGTATNISCLTCDLEVYFKNTSISRTLLNHSMKPFMQSRRE